MKHFILAALLFSISGIAFSQVVYTASAMFPFNGYLTESYTYLDPNVPNPNIIEYVDDRNGHSNSAVKLDGVIEYGNPTFSQMGSSDFTIAFWFRKDGSLWPEKSILQKKHLNVTDVNNVIHEEYSIYYNDVAGNSAGIRFKPFKDSATVNSNLGLIEENEWRHFTVVFDRSDSLYAYLDGQLYDTKYIGNTVQHEANIDSAILEIGNGNMSLDDLLFFDYALNSDEVDEVYNSDLVTINCICTSYNLGIYPNPNQGGIFNITLPDDIMDSTEVQLFDLLGNKIGIRTVQIANHIKVQMNSYASGQYILQLKTPEGILTERIEVI